MATRRRSITSTVPALFETATSAPQPECIRTPMAPHFMFELCLRMCYGEFISSFAACLGKIGHTMRGDSSWTRAGEKPNLIGQMGLIEIAEFCRHSDGAVIRRSFHVLQQRLEPHNPRQALWRKTYPIAEEAIQMAKTDLTIESIWTSDSR